MYLENENPSFNIKNPAKASNQGVSFMLKHLCILETEI